MDAEKKTPEQIALLSHWTSGAGKFRELDAQNDALLEKWAAEKLLAEQDAWYVARGMKPPR